PSKPGLSNSEMRAELTAILDRCAADNLNAVIFQIRPQGDALYDSKYEPWSYYLTGKQGLAPEGGFDPLEFVVEEAHDRGLEVHCWFNPFRANHPSQRGELSSRSVARRTPSIVKQYGSYMWMDPGEQRVQDWSFNVFMDVVERYDIDGVHIDDYFYPYPSYAKGADFPDGPSWQAYVDSGGTMTRDDWRRDNVNKFVERVYKGIKERKPWVKFGISPFGIYRPGEPEGIKSTFDQYAMLYADCKLWLQNGWLDYFTPQLYWKMDGDQSYRILLDYWNAQNTMNRHMWPGNFSGKMSPDLGDWPAQEILDQITFTRDRGDEGNVFYSMNTFMRDYKSINELLTTGLYKRKAIVPASPWLDDTPPDPPTCTLDRKNGLLTLAGAGKDDRFYAIYADKGDGLQLVRETSVERTQIAGLGLSNATTVAVSIVDKSGNESTLQQLP
ncbi:MAG TPA: family 10 glycosylhydrolase, partial [Fimbriimonadaceae bacterium]|nr:family 10 glycosylhydrolase [Fimbriimonadaceae bacterium]